MLRSLHDQRISRRQFLIGSAALSSFAVLVACAPPPAGEQAADTAAAAEAPAAEPTVAINSYGTASDPVVVWHGLGGADGATFATMLQQYTEEFPDRAVRSELYNWDVFFQKYPTAVAAGTPPDWAIHHAAEVPQMASEGFMMSMDDLFFSNGELPKEDFSPVLMDVISVDGSVMCVPFDNHGWVQFVNTKVISDAGLDPNSLPANGAEFIDFALKVTTDEAGKHPGEDGFNPDQVKVWAIDYTWPRFTIPSSLWQFGGGSISADQTTAMLDSDASKAAIQYWHDLMYTHGVCRAEVPGKPWGGELYKTDSIAIWWEGTWSLNYFKDNPDVAEHTIATGLVSLSPDGTQAAKMDSHIMSIPIGVSEAGIERARLLIKWLSDNGKTWATSGQIPARLSVQQDPDVQSIWSVKAAADQFNAFGRTEIPHPAFIEIQTAWETAVSAVLTNTTPIDQALSEGNAAIQEVLDRA
jgi:ABC-type glycerol-3-phosphate transport system substrate-binding protein